MIIGITGTLGAGKGTVVEYLTKKGFKHYSARGYLNEILTEQGKEHSRENMVELANKLRKESSPSHIAEKLFEKAKKQGGNAVIESLRTVGEVESLRKKGDFVLLAINAKPSLRYFRITTRESSTDNITYETFLEQELKEMISEDPNKQNLSAVIKMADYRLLNDGSIKQLEKKLEKILNAIKKQGLTSEKYVRPTWDEYFLGIMDAVAKRATCDRGRSGCVIARNKQLLVTGYVGSPNGLPHCDQVGHQMKQTVHEDGHVTNHCVRTTHAEQNAICQAAKKGISVEGATLYCRMEPCAVCAKMIINAGITRVICQKRYQAGEQSLLEAAGVKVEVLDESIEQY